MKYVRIQFHDGGRNGCRSCETVSFPDATPVHRVVEAAQRAHRQVYGDLRSDACSYQIIEASNMVDAIIRGATT